MGLRTLKPLTTLAAAGLACVCCLGCGADPPQTASPPQTAVPKEITQETQTPLQFGAQFTSVCKVGKRGGDGTLIAPTWVLTAAHVARGMFQRGQGEVNVYFEDQEHKVVRVFVHPQSGPMKPYDIALLELASPVQDHAPHDLYRASDELGAEIVLAGHGDKRDDNGEWIRDGQLRAYTNRIDEVQELRIIFDFDPPDQERTAMEGTSGPGDSGGPAFIEVDQQFLVAGISSMGQPGHDGPASYGAIEHFVRVSAFADWIDATMASPDEAKALTLADVDSPTGGQPGNGGEVVRPADDATGGTKELSNSPQAQTASQFLKALADYDEARMLQAISETFATSLLATQSPEQIMASTPVLYRQLQNAQMTRVISETDAEIYVELKQGETTYRLRMHFDETESTKLRQLGFGRL